MRIQQEHSHNYCPVDVPPIHNNVENNDLFEPCNISLNAT